MAIDPFVPQGEQVLGRCHPHPISLFRPLVQGLVSLGVGLGIGWLGGRLHQDAADLTGWEIPVAQLGAPLLDHTVLLALGFSGLALAIWGLAWLGWRVTEYLVTGPADPQQRGGNLIRVWGLIRVSWRTIPLRQVNDIGVDLPIWARLPGLRQLLDWGTIRVIMGNDRDVQTLPYVPQAAAFYQLCQQRRWAGGSPPSAGAGPETLPVAARSWFGNPR
jgi:hypothetical protein